MTVSPITRGGRPGPPPPDDYTDAMDDAMVLDAFPNDQPRRLGTIALTPEVSRERSRFRTYSPSALRALPPLTWIVEGIVPAGGTVAIIGAPKSGKTFLTMDLACSVASGRPFLGRPTQKGGVLYLSAEGVAGLPRRLTAWQQAHGVPDHALALTFVLESADLLEQADAWHLARAAVDSLSYPPALIIIDTFARVTPGAEENSATDVGLVVQNTDWIRERTGAAILFVHHTNAAGDRERGSTALRGAVDVLAMVADEDGRRVITCEAVKDAEPFDPITVELDVVELRDGADAAPTGVTSCVPRLSASHWTDAPDAPTYDKLRPNQLKALASIELAAGRGATATEWLDRAGLPKRTFYRVKDALVVGGYVIDIDSRFKPSASGSAALRWARAMAPGAGLGAGLGATNSAFGATAPAAGATRRAMGGVGGGSFTTSNSALGQPLQGAGPAEHTDLDRAKSAREVPRGAPAGATRSATRSATNGAARPGTSGRDRAANDAEPPAWDGPPPWEDDR